MQEQQVAILFSDVSGFSGLKPAQVSPFVNKVMRALADEIKKFKPIVKNTWGDGIFLVFATAQEAAECALALRDQIRNTDWENQGLPAELKIRFALHNAHATILKDPITGSQNAYGQHINQAARLEPVAIPNEIFATQEFKVALGAHQSRLFRWEDIGSMSLAKDWGETVVYRLLRATEEEWSEDKKLELKRVATKAELGKSAAGLKALMPNASKLLRHDRDTSPNTAELLKHVDKILVGTGVYRMNWEIEVRYDTSRLASDGIIKENLRWTYELINAGTSTATYPLKLVSAPDLEGRGGFISFHRIHEDGGEEKILAPELAPDAETDVFALRAKDIELLPQARYRLEMIYAQNWPVSREHPMLHNCFFPRESSFGINRLEIEATAKKVGLLFGTSNLELRPTYHEGNRYVFNIPSPIFRGQVLEFILTF